jgi:hypothetical protein
MSLGEHAASIVSLLGHPHEGALEHLGVLEAGTQVGDVVLAGDGEGRG